MAYADPRIGWRTIGNTLADDLTDNLIKLRRVLQEREVAAALVPVRDLDPHRGFARRSIPATWD